MTKKVAKIINQAATKMINAACLQAELEAMKAENAELEAEGKPPAHGYKQFMNTMERWKDNDN